VYGATAGKDLIRGLGCGSFTDMAPGGRDRPLISDTSAAEGGMGSPVARDERRLRRKDCEVEDPARARKSDRRSF
jgi:hypothetical protein